MKKEWDKLSSEQQKPFIDKATYLIERQYIKDVKIETIAKRIYQNTK